MSSMSRCKWKEQQNKENYTTTSQFSFVPNSNKEIKLRGRTYSTNEDQKYSILVRRLEVLISEGQTFVRG
jgi:hypothetical protein